MKTHYLLRVAACILLVFATFFSINAQTDKEMGEATIQALKLIEQQRFADAIPHLEVLVKGIPDSAEIRFMYGWCLVGKSKQISDTTEAKALSAKALEQFLKAKELGLKTAENESLIAILSGKAAPAPEPQYSSNKEAEKSMVEGESYFAQSKYDEAIKKFEKALALDPKLYQAALSGGDSYTAKSDWENAEKWSQRGMAIDPNRETAYRYSGTPLMKQKKYDLARERYIEAYITEPYSSMSARGIDQWADATGARLGHAIIDVPEVTFDASGKAVPKASINTQDASSRPWLAYLALREVWKKDKFAKVFPKEAAYRHSLQEEVESLRAAIAAAKEQKSPNGQFDVLAKLDGEGLLEAYVLLAMPDRGIAGDHPEYLKSNRAKLRQYVANYVIHK